MSKRQINRLQTKRKKRKLENIFIKYEQHEIKNIETLNNWFSNNTNIFGNIQMSKQDMEYIDYQCIFESLVHILKNEHPNSMKLNHANPVHDIYSSFAVHCDVKNKRGQSLKKKKATHEYFINKYFHNMDVTSNHLEKIKKKNWNFKSIQTKMDTNSENDNSIELKLDPTYHPNDMDIKQIYNDNNCDIWENKINENDEPCIISETIEKINDFEFEIEKISGKIENTRPFDVHVCQYILIKK